MSRVPLLSSSQFPSAQRCVVPACVSFVPPQVYSMSIVDHPRGGGEYDEGIVSPLEPLSGSAAEINT